MCRPHRPDDAEEIRAIVEREFERVDPRECQYRLCQREGRTTHGVARVATGTAEERVFHDGERERLPHTQHN